ncbi:MAG: hypothetical protein EXR99_13410 [Gemmataceae bacterium]|nr:hypothetical protein [Gemmataceae bacterium]
MTNHFHLLQPEAGQSLSRILQSVTVAHTWRYHRQCRTVGHVRQGRFKSPVIQEEDHFLVVLRYLEANPLRAGMVQTLDDYPWSGYHSHGRGCADALLSELPVAPRVRGDAEARQRWWRWWVRTPLTEKELSAVRHSATSGRPRKAEQK